MAASGAASDSEVHKLASAAKPPSASTLATRKLKRYWAATPASLRRDVAKAYGLAPTHLVLGSSSDELLGLVCALFLAPEDEAVIGEHSFSLYGTQILAVGAVPVIVKEAVNKTSIDSILKAVNCKTKLVFIAAPAYPTGALLASREITALRKALPAKAVLVLDLAYVEYVKDDRLVANRLLIGPNVIATGTFSKAHRLVAPRVS